MTPFENISSAALEAKIADGLTGVLLDVRTAEEVEEGKIPGALNIDVNGSAFDEKVIDLDPSKTYYVYCRSGGRSTAACLKMNSFGFKNLYNLEGGITAWKGEVE